MHGLPLAYSKDLQEDKEPLFDATELELCLRALGGMLPGIDFDRERMAAAAADEMAAATDVADLLVRRGLPFREAHGVVGSLVLHAVDEDIALSAIPPEALAGFPTSSTRSTTRSSKRPPGSIRRSPAAAPPRRPSPAQLDLAAASLAELA